MPYKDADQRREYYRAWYQANKDRKKAATAAYQREHPDKQREYDRKQKAKARDAYEARKAALVQLLGGACHGCGFDHIGALQFHHRDPRTKQFQISDALQHRRDWSEVLIEAAKCDLLCSNCHDLHHWKERRTDA